MSPNTALMAAAAVDRPKLRRSAASGMQRLGIRVEVIERILNHISGSFRGVIGVYQRDPLAEDARQALDMWAAHIAAIAAGKPAANVTTLRRKARGRHE